MKITDFLVAEPFDFTDSRGVENTLRLQYIADYLYEDKVLKVYRVVDVFTLKERVVKHLVLSNRNKLDNKRFNAASCNWDESSNTMINEEFNFILILSHRPVGIIDIFFLYVVTMISSLLVIGLITYSLYEDVMKNQFDEDTVIYSILWLLCILALGVSIKYAIKEKRK